MFAAVDLGSNSFRLHVGHYDGTTIRIIKSAREPIRLGAGLDWKTSLQELAAEHALGVPEYLISDEGPDHAKTFTAWVVVAGKRYGGADGRSKKEAEQRAAESAWRELSDRVTEKVAAPAAAE